MNEKLRPLPPDQTLGYRVLDWCRDNLVQPDGDHQGDPFIFTDEQAAFITHFYAVDGAGKFTYRRGVISRPKGWGKSPMLAAICCAELLGPVVYEGRDAFSGEPIGRPQASPLVQLAAVSEDQTGNTYDLVQEMLKGPALENYPSLDIGLTRTFSATGKLIPVTASSTSREGQRTTFAVLDETHLWNAVNGGHRLSDVLRRNLAKMNGRSIETTNAFVPGEDSVAEKSAEFAQKIRERKVRDSGLLYDHVEPPFEVDKTDEKSILAALRHVYGDAVWINFERIISEIWDPATDPQDSDRFYFNMITHATDSWLSQPEWLACQDLDRPAEPGDVVTLGFDGSRKRTRGVTDATALIGCRVSDGHLFQIAVWEQPEGPDGEGWEVPIIEVLAAVDDAFDRYSVVGFYADPAKWEGHVNTWEAKYGPRLQVKASANHLVEWWMTGGRASLTVRALEIIHNAIIDREMTHDGSFALTRHMLNARRRVGRAGVTIAKEHPSSPKKIDAAIAATLAFKARADAIAAGVTEVKKKSRKLYRF
ncbi:hypothetical protein [Kitasatospora mediocidica]|uniref:hypothetical protein n=1 Tax=Kitasatospora mediocidica TaxID=58352 RepID=UPI000568097A|nr:hypothetical protein [Kitasatospora mediocidica]